MHVSLRSSASEMFVDNNVPKFEALLREEVFLYTSRFICSIIILIRIIEKNAEYLNMLF